MRMTGRAIGLVLCGIFLTVLGIWGMRMGHMQKLDMRPEPQRDLMVSVLDRGKININLATAQQLEQLPGIGSELAEAIVKDRQVNGYFTYPEHLIRVKGISQTIVETLLDQICV